MNNMLRPLDKIEKDRLAIGVARAAALANAELRRLGHDRNKFMIQIDEEIAGDHRSWHVHYIPCDFINRRGGDISMVVDDETGKLQKVLYGQ